jgi:tetratricopeptide (TPR) repeat protein
MCRRKARICFVFLSLLIPAGLLFSVPSSSAESHAGDVCLQVLEKGWGIVLRIDHLNPYTIESSAAGNILLTMQETVPGSLFVDHLEKWKDILSLVPGNDHNLQLLVKLSEAVREVRSAWIQDKRLLFLRFFTKEKKGGNDPIPPTTCLLEDLRFGIRKKFVRTVMDLTSRPAWRFGPQGADRLEIFLEKAKNKPAARKSPPVKGMKEVRLKSGAGGVRIFLRFENPRTAFRLFWLDVGSRLVVDSYHLPDDLLAENMNLPSWFGKPEKTVSERPAVASVSKGPVLEAMPNISPVIVQGPLIAIPEKEQQQIPEQPKTAPETAPESDSDAGPKVTISFPKPPPSNPMSREDGRTKSNIISDGRSTPEDLQEEKRKFEPREAKLYGNILRARDLHHQDEVLELVDRFLANYPDSDIFQELSFMRANILFSRLQEGQKGTLNTVIQAYQDVINRYPRSDLALKCYVRMAMAYAEKGNHYLGISCLDLAIRRYQKDKNLGSAYLERGKIYLEKGLSEKAVEDFKTVLTRYPASPWTPPALFGIARYLQARGLYREAQKRLSRITELRPDFFMDEPDFLSVQAQNFLYLKEYAKARSYFYRAINLSDHAEGNDLLLMHIGDTYLQQSRRKEAEKFYALVNEIFPGSQGASIAELRLGELHGDVNKFKEVKKKNPNDSIAEIATLKVANAYYKSGLYQETMESLKELMAEPPKDSMVNAAKILFGQAAERAMEDLYKQEKFAEVVALFHKNQAVLKGRILPEKQLLVAESLQQMKDYAAAVSAYRDLDPADLNTDKERTYYLGLADCLWSCGLPGESIRFLEKALKEQLPAGNRLAVTRALADRYGKEGRFREASELYTAMIQEKKHLDTKEMADTYLSLGEVLNAQGKYQEARAVLHRSIALSERVKTLKPVLFSSLGQLAESYLKEGKYGDALGAFAQALGAGYDNDAPGFWDVRLGQADAYLGVGQLAAAENVLNEVYEGRGPDSRYWDLRYRLALEYVKTGSLQTGEKLLREVSEEGTPPALQSDAQIKLGSLNLRRELRKLSIWPQIGGQEQEYARQ